MAVVTDATLDACEQALRAENEREGSLRRTLDKMYPRRAAGVVLDTALAAGWVPPEEAEAIVEAANSEAERWKRRMDGAWRTIETLQARVRLLESSWVPPERVETIDCKRCGGRGEFLQSVSGEHGHYTTQPCPLCTRSAGGSGKLQIVTKETTP